MPRKSPASIGKQLNSEFVGMLRQVLKDQQLQQKAVAKKAKISQQAVSRILCDKHSPTLRTVGKLLAAAGVEVHFRLEQRAA